jgi:putative cardiolipin synthase
MPELREQPSAAAAGRGPPAADAAGLDAAVEAALRTLGGPPSAACLAAGGPEAFALRAAAARAARRSLDLQYYAWHADTTGRLLAREVLHAADRGVRVRLLLDDMYALGRERSLSALDAHPGVEVRLFNATRWRALGRAGMVLEMAFGGRHLNRRMHNKAWIADRRLALVGGRNIGDAYFDASDAFNFRDLDLLVAGAAAAEATAVFERYWRSPLSRPVAEVSAGPAAAREAGLAALRRELEAAAASPGARPYLERLRGDPDIAAILRGEPPHDLLAMAEGAVRVLADPPEKARGGARREPGMAEAVAAALGAARREALVISPYFVPGWAGQARLVALARRGVRVSVVTNSLAATDVVAVHGGYARHRRRLLKAGIELFELRPGGAEGRGQEEASLFGSRGASLHTKAFVVDEDGPAFVGSFNLDPRSARLNTEMGAFVRHPALARRLRAEHARLSDPALSWRLTLDARGGLVWGGEPGPREPGATLGRRLLARVVRWLPVESQL